MNPYEILGISTNADDVAVRKAYRQLVRLKHPDVNRLPSANAEFRAIQEAYEAIMNGNAVRESRSTQQRADSTSSHRERNAHSHTPPPQYDSAFKQRSSRGSECAQKLNENARMHGAAFKERSTQREVAQSVYDAELRRVDKLLRKRQAETKTHIRDELLEEAKRIEAAAVLDRDSAFVQAQEQYMKTTAEIMRLKDAIFKEYTDIY